MQQEFCVKCNGYHWTFALPSKYYFRNAIQMSMICQYLLVVKTHWLSMDLLLSCLIVNRPCLTCHFNEERPSCSPTKFFWSMAYVLKGFAQTVNSMLRAIKGMSTLLIKQGNCLELLVNTLKEDCNVNGPDQFTDVLEHVLCGSYQVSHEDAETLIKDQDPFILCLLEDIFTTAVPD